ncbi:MAG: DUF4390 domain-containing protein [Sterolibacterium sp.]
MLRLFVAACLFGLAALAWAGRIEPSSAQLTSGEDAYVLSADFEIDLGGHFEDAVSRGVPLYFVLELEITRNRWYWPSEHIAGRSLNYRLAYIPLTRQYRLSSGGTLHQNFATLSEALRVMGRVAALPVADKSVLKIGETYQVALRLALDRQQLPKPLQVDAIGNKDWQVEAKVLRWQFVPAVAHEREAK